MVWQDMPSVNAYTSNPQTIDMTQFENELRQMVLTQWNTPTIVMWTIFNASQGQTDTATKTLVPEVQALDPNRQVNQALLGDHSPADEPDHGTNLEAHHLQHDCW